MGFTKDRLCGLLWILTGLLNSALGSLVVQEYACFSQLFQIKCAEDELIVFETARYGRNDTHVAYQCGVPFKQTCDVDVNFSLNRVCAGKPSCNLAVNTQLFGDPCGYEEFLMVTYRCVPVSTIYMSCQTRGSQPLFDHGYLASPNYPGKYYMDAECFWKLSVQKRQTMKLTIFDFELDVRKAGQCSDYLEVSAGDRTYFQECGSLGKQEMEIEASEALVRFKTGTNSLTQRGFFIYFEALGPGCPDHPRLTHGHVTYYIEDDILYANASCARGYYFRGAHGDEHGDFRQLRCSGSFWNVNLGECVAIPPPTTPIAIEATTYGIGPPPDRKASVIGIALGIISAILLIVLLFILALYFHRRRRRAERKLDMARVVINNLQEGDISDENYKNMNLTSSPSTMDPDNSAATCNLRKAAAVSGGKRNNNRDTVYGGRYGGDAARNLLPQYGQDEDEYIMDYADCYRDFPACDTTTPSKHDADHCGGGGGGCGGDPTYGYVTSTPSRRTQRGAGRGQSRSQSGLLTSGAGGTDWERDAREKARLRRESRRRAKSGQWDPTTAALGSRSLHYAPLPASATPVVFSPPTPHRSVALTQSAPDLTTLTAAAYGCLPPPPAPAPRVPGGGGTTPHRAGTLPPNSSHYHRLPKGINVPVPVVPGGNSPGTTC